MGIKLTVEVREPDLVVKGRQSQLGQALVNLLGNAFDAIRTIPHPTIHITIGQRAEMGYIRITDNGPGIPAHQRDKVFEPFFTTKEVGQGTGLGLSITLGILQDHKGSLFLDEQDPQTSLVMEIPLFTGA